MVVAYVDEAGFAQAHPNRAAWTPRGQRHLIEATRGKRPNMLAAMLFNGERFSVKHWKATTSEIFVNFIGLLKKGIEKPMTIILDNASIHKASAIQPALELLKKQGVTLYFLPPYTPELNRIEKLWHLIKHTWMSVKCRNPQTLEDDVGAILSAFGTKFKLQF